MAVDVDTVISMLKQEGQPQVETADINRFITLATNNLATTFPSMPSASLDMLVTYEVVLMGYISLGSEPPSHYQSKYDKLYKAAVDTYNQDLKITDITDHQVYEVGDIPWIP